MVFSGRLDSEKKSLYQKDIIKELENTDKKVRDRIIFLNYVPYNDLKSIYTMSKMLLIPSLEEGFGVPLLEAMNCEIPIITSNISCMPEIVGNAALLCNPYNPKDMAEDIEKVITDSKLRKKLISLGNKRAKFFTQEKTAMLTYKYYSEYLDKKLMKSRRAGDKRR
jgi:glycosyltransferase involved in cell wall biosynthesis